jgi:hypothetical protein
MDQLRTPLLFYRPNVAMQYWVEIPRFRVAFMALTKSDLVSFSKNIKATYNESTEPATQPKPLYGAGAEALKTVLSYIHPQYVDNHHDLDDVKFDLSGDQGWEVLLREHLKVSNLEAYTLGKLEDELRRRGLTKPKNMKGVELKEEIIDMIEEDIEDMGEEEPDWTSRPPVLLPLPPGTLEYLQLELAEDVAQAERDARTKKKRKRAPKQPTLAHGWSKCKHSDMCWQGADCEFDDSEDSITRSLFECYYCTFSECGVCAGLSARQTLYASHFICSSCRSVAAEKAIVLSASSLE